MSDPRRMAPRIGVEALCSEIIDGRERHALVADLSPEGLRLSRPYVGGPTPRLVQLELELPGMDEIIWAKGHICFDQIHPGRTGLVRTSGVRVAAAAARDLRILRDYVIDMWRRLRDQDDLVLAAASCYARG
jgi:hypothetical protein